MFDPSVQLAGDLGDCAEDVRRVFRELEQQHPAGCPALAGECSTELDVFETADLYQVVVDLPGVAPDSLRVLIKRGVLIVAGEKLSPPSAPAGARFHLAERNFGRFARAVRLPGAIEISRAHARLHRGELTITVPKIEERRGRPVPIAIQADPS